MKTYSKQELETQTLEVFEQHPKQDTIYAREDGNIFFDEHYANLDRGKLKVYPFNRADIVKGDVKKIKVVDAAAVTEKAKTTTAAKEKAPVAPAQEVKKVDATLGKDGKNPETRETTNPTV